MSANAAKQIDGNLPSNNVIGPRIAYLWKGTTGKHYGGGQGPIFAPKSVLKHLMLIILESKVRKSLEQGAKEIDNSCFQ